MSFDYLAQGYFLLFFSITCYVLTLLKIVLHQFSLKLDKTIILITCIPLIIEIIYYHKLFPNAQKIFDKMEKEKAHEKHKLIKGILVFLFLIMSLLSFILVSIEYHNTEKQSAKASESVQLNNQGFVFLEKYRYGEGDEAFLDSALGYFDKALMLDKNNLMATQNRNVVLNYQKKYAELIEIVNEQLEKTDTEDFASNAILYHQLALLHYSLEDTIQGNQALSKAKACFEIGLDKSRSVELITEYVDFIAQTEGKESAFDELEKHKDFLQQAERYETLKEYLLLNEFDQKE